MSALPAVTQRASLVSKFASKFNIDPDKLLSTLKATAFKVDGQEVSHEQMAALLIVADQYGLNPFTRELFAFPDKRNGIVPVVSVDGWCRIINDHPQFDGVEFEQDEARCTCVIYRKDRSHAVKVTEYMSECKRGTQPWSSHPMRMLRHKTLIQCARIAFGFSGIYDEDEAHRIVNAGTISAIDEQADGMMPRAKAKAITNNTGQTIDGVAQVVEPEKVAMKPEQPAGAPTPQTSEPSIPHSDGNGNDAPAASGPNIGPLLQEGAKKTLRAAMDRAGWTEQDLADKFSFTVDTLPFSLFNDAMKAIQKK